MMVEGVAETIMLLPDISINNVNAVISFNFIVLFLYMLSVCVIFIVGTNFLYPGQLDYVLRVYRGEEIPV
jgi:hypothetical protein